MKLFVKNMVSLRCILFMKSVLKELGFTPVKVTMGEIETEEELTELEKKKLNIRIKEAELELLEKRKDIIVEKIKHVIIDYIYNPDEQPNLNFSDLLSQKLNYNYNYLSNLFLETENITITQYIIRLKIERIKELILLEELTLTEIAYKLHYSSCSHLSNQFKKITGLPPSKFQKQKVNNRLAIQEI